MIVRTANRQCRSKVVEASARCLEILHALHLHHVGCTVGFQLIHAANARRIQLNTTIGCIDVCLCAV